MNLIDGAKRLWKTNVAGTKQSESQKEKEQLNWPKLQNDDKNGDISQVMIVASRTFLHRKERDNTREKAAH